jgi:MFS transporter, UMF1 family
MLENHMRKSEKGIRRAQFAWAMYDFANTIFSMNIVTFFFSPWIIITLGVEDIWFSLAYSASMIVVAFTMPGLGRKADQTAGKIRGLRSFTLMCILFTVLLSLVAILHLGLTVTAALALLCFACANYYYEGGITYYNALLSDVSNPSNVGKISGIGVGLGYIGAIAGLWLAAPFVDGTLSSSMSGREYAFLPTAIFFLIFALPAFFWIKEREHTQPSPVAEENYFKRMSETLKETRDYPGVLRFLISDFLVEDAIATTIVFMAVYAEAVVGFAEAEKRILFLSSTAFAFAGSFLFGYLSDRIRPKNALIIALVGWVSVLAIGVGVSSKSILYVVGALVGMFLGAVWTTARPLLNSLVPAEKLGQFYGLYSLSGRSAATVGPLIWGLIALLGKHDMPLGRIALSTLSSLGVNITENLTATIHYRLALASLLIAMLAGLAGFIKVPNRRRYSSE